MKISRAYGKKPPAFRSRVFLVFSLLLLPTICRGQSASPSPSASPTETADRPAHGQGKGEHREKLKHYKGKDGIISAKTVVLGGDFRVTTVIPFKGNLADYHHLEIASPISLVGPILNSEVKREQMTKFKSQFEERQIFKSVILIDSYDPTAIKDSVNSRLDSPFNSKAECPQTDDHSSSSIKDSLDAPIGTIVDMEARDTERLLVNADASPAEDRTLVVVIEVLDYLKGNRVKQLLPLDLGKAILTVRVRYYDRDSGEEIGRQIISGENSGSALLGPVSPRTALSGVSDGFVDQVTRRIAESER
jgi:hypothetical protein